jgi:branched-chain amino acid transport system permease protein
LQGYILAGLVLGSVYAISALGLVLTYASSRVVNFAHGATAYAVAIFYHWLNHEQGWSIPASALVSLLVFSPLLGLGLWALLFRWLTHAPAEIRFLATVGLWVALPAAVRIVFPFSQAEVYQPQGLARLPAEIFHLSVFDLSINANQLVILVGGAAIVVGLTVILRLTPMGLATRATVDSPRSAEVSGINTRVVTAGSWALGTTMAGFAGILLAPLLGLNDLEFTLLLVASIAAAVVGRLTSLPLTFAGAMVIGLIQGVSVDFLPSTGVLARGFKPSVPFIVMLACLLLYQGLRRERFEVDLRSGSFRPEAPAAPRARGWRAALGPLAVVLALFSVPIWLNDFWIGVVTQGVALGILFLTFTIVTGEGGMLSLCQATLAGVGGFTAVALATHSTIFGVHVPDWFGSGAGWPLGLAILAGAILAVPVGLLVASLSLRLGGVYLALATLAFSLLVEQLVFARSEFDNFGAGIEVTRPIFLGIDFNDRTNFFLLLAVIFCVVAVLVVNLRRATTGLVLASMRSSEQGAATIGVSIVRSRLLAFAVSSFVAGLGGALYAVTIERAQPTSFNVLVGIVWLAIVVTWGVRSVLGALIAGIVFAVVPQKLIFIVVIALVLTAGALVARLVMSGRIRTPAGAVMAAVVAAVGIVGTGLLLTVDVHETVAGVSVRDLPTMLFGLGAVFLAREPRGILFNVVNRLRLREARRQAGVAEPADPAAGLAEARA